MPLHNWRSRLSAIWLKLIEPQDSVEDLDERREARLMTALLLGAGLLVGLSIIISLLTGPFGRRSFSDGSVRLVSLGLLIIAYVYSRRGFHRQIAIGATVLASLTVVGYATSVGGSEGQATLSFLIAPLLFSSLFLPMPVSLLIFVLNLLVVIGSPLFIPGMDIAMAMDTPFQFNLLIGMMVLLFGFYRRRLESERQRLAVEKDEHYRAISELVSDYAYAFKVGPNNTLVGEWSTNTLQNLTGYEREEVNIRDVTFPYWDTDLELGQLDRIRTLGNHPTRGEYRIRTKEGKERWVEVHRQPVYDSTEKRVIRYYGVARDITDRKRAEEERLLLSLHQERLSVMSDFVLGVSHDFRNSAAIIETSRYLLGKLLEQEHPDRQQMQNKLDTMRAGIEHLTVQLDNLQSIATLVKPQPAPCELNQLINGVIQQLRSQSQAKRLFLKWLPYDETLRVVVDGQQISHAVNHLLTNAINFTPPGGSISVRLFRTEEHIGIEVRDTGIGIAEEHLGRIFEPFFRVDPARSTETGGIGLGLSIAKLVAEAHHGRLRVQSVEGQGSTFTLTLPLPKEDVS